MDRIFESWLAAQNDEWERFAPQTDRVSVTALGPESPARKFVAEFDCQGLVRQENGEIASADAFAVAIYFSDDHHRRLDPLGLAWVLWPPNVWHPNVQDSRLCVGHLRPGVELIELLHQIHSILTWQNANLKDFLNPEAAGWARDRRDQFPIDTRPLKRRELRLNVTEVTQ